MVTIIYDLLMFWGSVKNIQVYPEKSYHWSANILRKTTNFVHFPRFIQIFHILVWQKIYSFHLFFVIFLSNIKKKINTFFLIHSTLNHIFYFRQSRRSELATLVLKIIVYYLYVPILMAVKKLVFLQTLASQRLHI